MEPTTESLRKPGREQEARKNFIKNFLSWVPHVPGFLRGFIFPLILISLLAACGRAAQTTIVPTTTKLAAITIPATATAPKPATPTPPAVDPKPVSGMPQGTDDFPWWNDSIFYEIFVRSFYDSNGDGIGDFNGILEKLDYLNDGNPQTHQDLGITGIWLMPIFPAASYHGYDVTDYSTVNPQYGTLDDFKKLLAEAHKRGIRIILDFPLNHTSDKNPWFQASEDPKSPYRNWYVWSDAEQGQYWHAGPNGDYYGYFGANMPDLNYTNPEVTKEMEKVTSFWLKDVGVDGFRLDAAKYLIEEGANIENTAATHTWYKQFRTFYKGINPQAMTVGEITGSAVASATYAQGDQLDLAFDFNLADSMIASALGQDDSRVSQTLTFDKKIFKPDQFAAFLSNHDQNRVFNQLGGDLSKSRSAAEMLLTMTGVPFIYYGEELGMSGAKPDEQIRTPMNWSNADNGGFTTGTPWEASNGDYKSGRDVADETKDPNSLLSLYRDLIQLRNEHVALRVGDFSLVKTDNPAVYAALRTSKSESALVLINLSTAPVNTFKLTLDKSSLKTSYHLQAIFGTGSATDLKVDGQGGFQDYQPVQSLDGNACLVFQLQPAK